MNNIEEQTIKWNRIKREADLLKIGSPFRIHKYIQYRLKGYSVESALNKTKSTKT